MELLVVRHAIAEARDPGVSAETDAARRLTSEGKKRFRRGARGLRRLVPELDLIATSPLVRAVQTAQILAEFYEGVEMLEAGALAPAEASDAVASWLAERVPDTTVALVGHEPALGLMVGWLLSGKSRGVLQLKKGAACLLSCPGSPGAGTATLLWSLRPGHLRRLR